MTADAATTGTAVGDLVAMIVTSGGVVIADAEQIWTTLSPGHRQRAVEQLTELGCREAVRLLVAIPDRPPDDPLGARRWYGDRARAGWRLVDLADVLAGDLDPPTPTILRVEGAVAPLLYAGAVNSIHGESGIGKSWVALHAITEQIAEGRPVCVLDYEDTEATLCARLIAYGATPDQVAEHLLYLRPPEREPGDVERLAALLHALGVVLVVLDSVGDAFAADAVNEDRDNEVGPWMREVADVLAGAGPAVLLIDHGTKAADAPLYPSGSKRKRSAVSGASYLVEEIRPLEQARGSEPRGGRLSITCAKDRHGAHRRGEVVAIFDVTSYPDGGVRGHFWPPQKRSESRATTAGILAARSAVAAAKASADDGSPTITLRALRAAMSIKASNAAKDDGIELAAHHGALAETAGPRRSRVFAYVKDLDL